MPSGDLDASGLADSGRLAHPGHLADPVHPIDSGHPIDPGHPKVRQILAGARATFLECGYGGASVDEIARRARVSKGTLYNYFPDKRRLFAAVVDEECRELSQRLFTIETDGESVEATLTRIATSFVRFVVSPFALGMYRIAVAESQRIPEVGRVFYASGPELGTARLAAFLAAARERGELVVEDADLAACQFAELCRAELFHKVLFGVIEAPSGADIDRIAEAAVRLFLIAHGPKAR
ncbi:TetR/AcrR family transcriptional regulator [Algihabitans albus]|uniref:TetR/AcrR family transcriptional regulator n=1 Tax=Algihabitans albus TaxID=2164067 RepID=UPI000E5D6A5A|nr:TetR/AcrR family transcriptional regulator [Algihabitans albus]